MSRRALALVALLPACSSPCFVADDATPGWKRVALAPGVPLLGRDPLITLAAPGALAAPDGVDQFRSGEPAIVWERDQPSPPPDRPRLGVVEYRLPAGGARVVDVEFAAALDGARVDVSGETAAGAVPLVDGRRVSGRALRVEWERDDVRALDVTIHRHLRALPIVARWRMGAPETLVGASPYSAADRQSALFYRQPAGPPVELCPAPGRRLSLARASEPPAWSAAAPVALARAPLHLMAR
jgi:hypothetical protein